jgi:cholesterol oxidase
MGYSLSFHAENGEAYVLEGFKDVHNDRVIDFWYDTTALFTTLRRRDDLEGDSAQTGLLRIRIIDLVSQVLSMRNPNGGGLKGQIAGLLRFNWFFSFTLAREYARTPRRNKGAKSS